MTNYYDVLARTIYLNLTSYLVHLGSMQLSENRAKSVILGKQIWYDLLTVIKPRLTLEIGAQKAEFSCYIKKQFPESTCLAFEGSPKTWRTFKDGANKHGVVYLNKIVSNIIGNSRFNIVSDLSSSVPPQEQCDGRNSILELNYTNQQLQTNTIIVEATTIDHIISQYELSPICLWVDVEGASKQILEGASVSFLNDKIASIYIESESSQIWKSQWTCFDVISFLLQFGFVPVFRDCELPEQGNYIFVHKHYISGTMACIIQQHLK